MDFRNPNLFGTTSTGAEVIFYSHNADPMVATSGLAQSGVTGSGRWDTKPTLVSLNTTKTLGGGSGHWSLILKPGKDESPWEIFDRVTDGDWVDIVLQVFDTKHHVMRGRVDDIRRSTVSSSGTRVRTYTISGRDFTSVWEDTPIWFNVFTLDNIAGSVSMDVIGAVQGLLPAPDELVHAFLSKMLVYLANQRRAVWEMPKHMPGVGKSFGESTRFDSDGFNPSGFDLLAISAADWLHPSGVLWQLATEWSDGLYNELFCDLYRSGESVDRWYQSAGLKPADSKMTVVFRERPFVSLEFGESSPWFGIPLYELPREHLTDIEVGRGSAERYNAFFVAPALVQSIIKSGAIDMTPPLWDRDDVFLRGLRRFDISSKYWSSEADLIGLASRQREKLRDWHCLNPYMLQGTIVPAMGLPDLRVGTRLRIPGLKSEHENETYYVENVSHSWQKETGIQTQIGVTRGWIGTDIDLIDAVRKMAGRYTIGSDPAPQYDGLSGPITPSEPLPDFLVG